ncbi:hypothetical protein Clacol_002865 [Clathrus columnatus]|uniref:Major facilitator superfamily (MFS) profile domain-containing protein n=1 Tax=Clathrus columnatus TaxID=1419009 RepID=A0AAV5A7U8_9AGAM|nr:hypothetical protein Clacol_002865 [Clathrus columnatus]
MEWNAVVDLAIHKYFTGLVVLNLCLILPLLTASINGYDSSVVNGLQLLPDWQSFFHKPNGTALGFVNAAQGIGSLIAIPIAPYASDGIGRKRTLLFGSLILVGGTILQVLSRNLTHFIAARAIIGFGLCFATNAAPLLITELAYPTQRGPITALYNSSWYAGSIIYLYSIAAWATFAAFKGSGGSIWSWRFIPESPRWLISKGRDTEAMQILARYHANGGHIRDPLVVFEWTQIRHALQLEREISKTTTWLTLFKSPGNRKRMRIILAIGLFSQWSGNGLVSYYINLVLEAIGIQDTQTKIWVNGVLQVWNLVVAVVIIPYAYEWSLAFAMWTLTTALFQTQHNVAAAKATMGILFAFYLFYDMAYTPMLVAYTLEILPFSIRAKGFSLMNLLVCAALAFNQFVNPWALQALGWKYYLVYDGWLVFELLFVLKYVIETKVLINLTIRTKGRTLEETATLFDGVQEGIELHEIGTIAATQSLHSLRNEGVISTAVYPTLTGATPRKVDLKIDDSNNSCDSDIKKSSSRSVSSVPDSRSLTIDLSTLSNTPSRVPSR